MLPTVLGGGGIWNPAVVPASATTLWGLLGATVAVLALLLGGRTLLREHRDVVVAGGVGLVLTLLPVVPGGGALVEALVQHVPGGGLLRDSHKWLATYVVLVVLAGGEALRAVRADRTVRAG